MAYLKGYKSCEMLKTSYHFRDHFLKVYRGLTYKVSGEIQLLQRELGSLKLLDDVENALISNFVKG
jgi:hypothetical protein